MKTFCKWNIFLVLHFRSIANAWVLFPKWAIVDRHILFRVGTVGEIRNNRIYLKNIKWKLLGFSANSSYWMLKILAKPDAKIWRNNFGFFCGSTYTCRGRNIKALFNAVFQNNIFTCPLWIVIVLLPLNSWLHSSIYEHTCYSRSGQILSISTLC